MPTPPPAGPRRPDRTVSPELRRFAALHHVTSPGPAAAPSERAAGGDTPTCTGLDLGDLFVVLAEELATVRRPAEVAQVVVDLACRRLGVCAARIAAVDPGRGTLRTLGQRPVAPHDLRFDVIDESTPSGIVARTGRPLYLSTPSAIARELPGAVADPSIGTFGSIAGVPLTAEGVVTGVLCLAWTEACTFGPQERAVLGAIARFGATALHRATLAETDHAIGAVLRATLLPQALPDLPGLTIGTVYRPLAVHPEVGGDWYDAFELPSGRIMLVVGDVQGHGTSAARTMGKVRFSARAYAIAGAGPAEVLARTNALLRHQARDQVASMLCADYDPATRTVEIASAGHPPALLVPAGGPATFLDVRPGPMLGATDAATYRAAGYAVPAGTAAVFYTDGLVERRDRHLDEGLAGLSETATALRRCGAGVQRLATAIADALRPTGPPSDDVCVLAVAHA